MRVRVTRRANVKMSETSARDKESPAETGTILIEQSTQGLLVYCIYCFENNPGERYKSWSGVNVIKGVRAWN